MLKVDGGALHAGASALDGASEDLTGAGRHLAALARHAAGDAGHSDVSGGLEHFAEAADVVLRVLATAAGLCADELRKTDAHFAAADADLAHHGRR